MYDLRQRYGKDCPVITLIGSIRDKHRLDEVFDAVSPGGRLPRGGAQARAADGGSARTRPSKTTCSARCNVARIRRTSTAWSALCSISTDKAVNPDERDGRDQAHLRDDDSDADGEKTNTKFVAVRFGNVLGSQRQRHPAVRKPDSRRAAPSPSPIRISRAIL